jgi:ATP-dependent Clp protease adaptor protein ClpS
MNQRDDIGLWAQDETGPGESVAETTKEIVKPPPMYKVILHNDDYTTMEFVVEILTGIFRKSADEAVGIMLNVHHQGYGLAGVYSKQVAETKIAAVHDRAQSSGFPLRCSMEPE